MQVDEAVDGMPELLPAGYMDSDDESDSDESEDSGHEGDSEGMEDGGQFGSGPRLTRYVKQTVERMYETGIVQMYGGKARGRRAGFNRLSDYTEVRW